MRKNIFLGLFLFSIVHLSAQEQFGPATFTVPAGWQVIRTANLVTLEKPSQKGSVCKIFISAATKGAVNTETDYIRYRAANGGSGIIYPLSKGVPITRYEGDGLTSFFSIGTTTQSMVSVRSYFYSLSNGSQTFFYQLLTSNNQCINEFNVFQATLKMETEDGGSTKARAKRKSSGGAPAPPAPIM
ncbi:MAG TPA: hypothetical protein P5158_08730 [Chitinophagaceae bacterium]|nr:hypothetical protein [Chitinophagales bacterium]HRX94187.1 hypothetical protein [Chitinophagaceae bacterium]